MKKRLDYSLLEYKLKQLFRARGVITSAVAIDHLAVSQPVFSRLIRRLAPKVMKVGSTKKARYGLLRESDVLESPLPVYEIFPDGSAQHCLDLVPLEPGGYLINFREENIQTEYSDHLPWFLDDLRPMGFLGRLIPKKYPDLMVPDDIRQWNETHCLDYLSRYGWDNVGSFVIGSRAFQSYLDQSVKEQFTVSSESETDAVKYEDIVQNILNKGLPGSSAAGEQPKFLYRDHKKNVLVKFSPPIVSSIGRRRADLLICESLALQVCHEVGMSAATSRVIEGDTRIFLELDRFDRTERGRRGLVSLGALNSEFLGMTGSWSTISRALNQNKRIDESIHREICRRHLLGRLIGNTDMHPWNLSFYLDRFTVSGLSPIYDMLPMFYAPRDEQIQDQEFIPPAPMLTDSLIWEPAYTAALEFWVRVSQCPLISKGFRRLCAPNIDKVRKLKPVFEKLP